MRGSEFAVVFVWDIMIWGTASPAEGLLLAPVCLPISANGLLSALFSPRITPDTFSRKSIDPPRVTPSGTFPCQ